MVRSNAQAQPPRLPEQKDADSDRSLPATGLTALVAPSAATFR